MAGIPKIIHQIWGGTKPLPEYFEILSQTWKSNHPDWRYEFWDDTSALAFVKAHYPQYLERYEAFTYNIQRWDTIRYLILYTMGGAYFDFDTECLEPIDPLIGDKDCWFSLEPIEHAQVFGKDRLISTALIGSAPGHAFISKIIEHIFDNFEKLEFSTLDKKGKDCLKTTGPLMVTSLYEQASREEQNDVTLIPAEYLSPLNKDDRDLIMGGGDINILEEKLQEAYAVHYFFNVWLRGDNYST